MTSAVSPADSFWPQTAQKKGDDGWLRDPYFLPSPLAEACTRLRTSSTDTRTAWLSPFRMRNVGTGIKSDEGDEAVSLALRCLYIMGGARTCTGQAQPVRRACAMCRRRWGRSRASRYVVHQKRCKARSGEVDSAVAVCRWWCSHVFARPILYSTCVLRVLAEPNDPRASWYIAQGSIGGLTCDATGCRWAHCASHAVPWPD